MEWRVDPEKSTIAFTGKQMGSAFSGTLPAFTAEIFFDPADISQARVLVAIDTTKASTGDAERDATLKGGDWLDIKNFPAARFESKTFVKIPDGTYKAEGTLTIRDLSVPLALPFSLDIVKDDSGKETAQMRSVLTVDRAQLQLGRGEWTDPSIIANEVTLTITLAAQRIQ